MENKTKSSKNAIIIGAGPAGLTAAYMFLKNTEFHPIIYEESEFIGGIARTQEYHGNRIDLGGHRFFSKNDQVMELWKELIPLQGAPAIDDKLLNRSKPLAPGGPDPEKTDIVMLIRDRVSRIFFLRKFFDYPISFSAQTFLNMGLGRTLKAGFGYIGAVLFKRPENSLEDFYINRFGKPLYEMFFEDYTEKLWGVHPSQIAPDWGAQRVKGLSLSKAILAVLTKPFKKGRSAKEVETSLIEQFYYPKKGPGQLWEYMAQKITEAGGEIHLNSRVTEIQVKDGQITSLDVAHAGQTEQVHGEVYLSSMPVKDLVLGMGEAVPSEVRQVAAVLPYRDFITVGLLVNKLKIKNQTHLKTIANIVPDCWIYMQEREVKIGRLQIFNNWSPYMVKDVENTVWIGLEYFCTEGDSMWNASDAEFIDFASAELEKVGIVDRADILDSVRIRVKKAYPAYFGSYSEFFKVRDYLDTLSNLYCIGRNGQHKYNNMDHSMLTAIEAVNAIQNHDSDRAALWKVNTEAEYHEEKKN
jgi:protoporphyrinogen oxidase